MNQGGSNDDSIVGIYVARTASTLMHIVGKYWVGTMGFWRVIASATYSESADTGAYDGYNNDNSTNWTGMSWFKIVWDSGAGTIAFLASFDGLGWIPIITRSGQSQPDRIGLAIYSNSAGVLANRKLACAWFRVTEP